MDIAGTIVTGVIVLALIFFFFDGHEAVAAIWLAKAKIATERRREAEARAKEARYKALGKEAIMRTTEPRYRPLDDQESQL